MPHEIWITQIADHKVVSLGLAEAWKLEISAANPKAFPLEAPDQVMTDESTGPADQGDLCNNLGCCHMSSSPAVSTSGQQAECSAVKRLTRPPTRPNADIATHNANSNPIGHLAVHVADKSIGSSIHRKALGPSKAQIKATKVTGLGRPPL